MFSVFESQLFEDSMAEIVRKMSLISFFTMDIDFRPENKSHTYYCMNPKCSKNYYKGYCFRCKEEELLFGLVVPHKRFLNIL